MYMTCDEMGRATALFAQLATICKQPGYTEALDWLRPTAFWLRTGNVNYETLPLQMSAVIRYRGFSQKTQTGSG